MTSRNWRRRITIGGGIAAGLVGLLVVGLCVVDLGGVVRGSLLRRIPAWEERLGVTIQVGAVHLRLLPVIRAQVEEVRIAAAPGQPQLQLRLGRARLQVPAWPLLRSLGRRLQVADLLIEGLTLEAARLPDGRMSWEPVLARLGPRPRGMTAEQQDLLQRLSIRQLSLREGAVRLLDPQGRELALRRIALSAADLALDRPLTVRLEAAVAADEPNLRLALTLRPQVRDLQDGPSLALFQKVELGLSGLDLGPLLSWARPGPALTGASLRGELVVESPAVQGALALRGELLAAGVRLSQGRSQGQPADVRVQAEVSLDPLAGELRPARLSLAVGDMSLSAHADLRRLWTAPEVHALELRSSGLRLERLLALLPPALVPARLQGPVELSLKASGTPAEPRFQGRLELPGARVRAEGRLGRDRLALELDPCEVDPVRLAQAVPLLQRRLAGLPIGRTRLRLALQGDPQRPASLRVRVTDLDLQLAGGRLRGSGEGSGFGSAAPRLRLDLTGDGLDLDRLATAVGAGGERRLPEGLDAGLALHLTNARARGIPWREIRADAALRLGLLTLRTLRLQALGGTLDGSGTSLQLTQEPVRYHLRARFDQIDLAQLAALQPAKEGRPRVLRGRASGTLELEGAALPWAALSQRLAGQVDLRLTGAHVKGASVQATIVNPMLSRVGRPGGREGTREMDLRWLSLRGRIGEGWLRLSEPLRFETAEGRGDLTGSIALSGDVSLRGELSLWPQAVAAASGGRLQPRGEVPVRLRIGGAFPALQIELLDLGRTAAALLGAGLRGRFRWDGPR